MDTYVFGWGFFQLSDCGRMVWLACTYYYYYYSGSDFITILLLFHRLQMCVCLCSWEKEKENSHGIEFGRWNRIQFACCFFLLFYFSLSVHSTEPEVRESPGIQYLCAYGVRRTVIGHTIDANTHTQMSQKHMNSIAGSFFICRRGRRKQQQQKRNCTKNRKEEKKTSDRRQWAKQQPHRRHRSRRCGRCRFHILHIWSKSK